MKGQRGFTLVEMLVALAVFALVMAAVYSSVSAGLKARDEASSDGRQNARAGMDAIAAHLQSAFILPGSGGYAFSGTSSSISFYSFPPDKHYPLRIEYYIGGSDTCSGLCRRIFDESSGPSAPAPPEEPIAPEVKSIEFVYMKSGAAQSAWNSSDELPSSIGMTVHVRKKTGEDVYHLEAGIPLSERMVDEKEEIKTGN